MVKHTVKWRGPLVSPPGISPSLPAFPSVLESLPVVVVLPRCCCGDEPERNKSVIRTLAYQYKNVK